MLIKLKFYPADGSIFPTQPLVGLKEDLPLTTQTPTICNKLGISDFEGYCLYKLPGGVDGPVGEQVGRRVVCVVTNADE